MILCEFIWFWHQFTKHKSYELPWECVENVCIQIYDCRLLYLACISKQCATLLRPLLRSCKGDTCKITKTFFFLRRKIWVEGDFSKVFICFYLIAKYMKTLSEAKKMCVTRRVKVHFFRTIGIIKSWGQSQVK